jgi:hypothetical protein
MKHWEYKVLELEGKDLHDEDLLDKWGTQGWTLVLVVGKKAFMKRELLREWTSE